MICPKCEYEYIDGIEVCPDCQTSLIPDEEFEGHLVTPKDWIIAYTTEHSYEAEMLKSNLEGADIETLVLNQQDRNFPAQGDFSVIKVLVKKSDSEDALKIINDIEETQIDEGDETE